MLSLKKRVANRRKSSLKLGLRRFFVFRNYSADSGNSTGISEYLFSAAFGIAALDCFADSSLSAVSTMENGRGVCLVGVPHSRSRNCGDCDFSAASDLPETPEGNAPRKLILCG